MVCYGSHLFVGCISADHQSPADLFPEGQQEAATFVELAVVGANWHAKRINDRLRWAVSAAAVAAVLTLLSLVLVVTISPTDPRTEVADLSLASKAFRTVSRICPASVVAPPAYNVILGAIDPNDTSDDVISLRLNSSECHGPSLSTYRGQKSEPSSPMTNARYRKYHFHLQTADLKLLLQPRSVTRQQRLHLPSRMVLLV